MLLGCLLTALLFPAALMGSRVDAGRLLPATAPVTGQVQRAEWEDYASKLAHENIRMRQAMLALPPDSSPIKAFLGSESVGRQEPVPAVPARLLHRDVSGNRHSFLIDAGSERGLDIGFAVAHANSLVGIVQVVAEGASRVIRIDDPSSHTVVPAIVLRIELGDDGRVEPGPRPGGVGVARGAGKGTIIVGKLEAGGAEVGDLVVTGNGRYGVPAGLLLGEVVSFDDEDRNGEWEAVVRPVRDLDTIVAVFVCIRPKLAPQVAPRTDDR